MNGNARYRGPAKYEDPKKNHLATPDRYEPRETKTDRTRWRLKDEEGRQTWVFLKTKKDVEEWPQTIADKHHLGLDVDLPASPPAITPVDAIHKALAYFEKLQLPSGQWACEYGGPMFLLPGFVITWYVTGTVIPEEFRIEIANYLWARQAKDGGWGLHVEGQSTVFGTAMNYTVLRILGQDSEDMRLVKARHLLHEMGGAVNGPHWAKFWLSVLNVCEWDIVNPAPPELWLLPDWVPIAPWRWWIHMRQVFLPMSYVYSSKYKHPLTPLTRSLRSELHVHAYSAINFSAHRNSISPRDNYHPKSLLLHTINWLLLNVLLPLFSFFPSIKKRAENHTYQLIQWEDENTDYSCLAPVNAPMNTLACFIREGPNSYAVERHVYRLHDYLWMSSEGMMANGTNGVQSWDTAFFIQAVVGAGLAERPEYVSMLIRALRFLEAHQFRSELPKQKEGYRQIHKGAWGFSNRDQGYTVSDCTSEALKAVLLLQNTPGYPQLISDDRIYDAINVVLTMQNASSGGFSSYEPQRAPPWLMEPLNAAEVFGRIMVEYDYPECTSAVLTGLSIFHDMYPTHRAEEIKYVTKRAVQYLHDSQRPDGSWYGSWAICFTYAIMFALDALATCASETYTNSEEVRRACKFLLDRQNEDGGWGESYKSCEDGVWTPHPKGSQVVNTAWAAIALMEAGLPDVGPIDRAMRLIVGRQDGVGRWKQEGIEGVFNKSCMISYPNYKYTFTIKALGMYATRTGTMVWD